MSEEYDDVDEYVIVQENEESSNRPFLVAAGALVGILLLSLLCLGAVRLFGGGGDDGTPVADESSLMTATSISATNEAIATQNSFVTQTIVAMKLTDEAPTATPTATEIPPTNTPTNTPSPTPTDTPVVQEGEEPETDVTPNIAATQVFEGLNTATPASGVGGTGGLVVGSGTPTGGGTAVGGGTTTGTGTLPQTGISMWEALAAAFGLLFIFIVARRLRAS